MANHNLPTIASTYANFVTELDARLDDLAKGLDVSATNLPVDAVKWSAASFNWQKWNGSQWNGLSSRYAINIDGTVGATAPAAGYFTTATISGTATLPADTTIGGGTPVTTGGTQTLVNKTLSSPAISSISNSGTITLPTGNRTLVATDTTDTLSNKTLVAPKFADLGYIADPNGAALLAFDSTPSAVNFLEVDNASTGTPPRMQAQGSDVNIDINLVPKGSGALLSNGVAVVTTSGVQSLTNKTLSTGSTWSGNTLAVSVGGTGSTAALSAGGIIYAASSGAYASTGTGGGGQVLTSGGASAPSWTAQSSLSVGYASTAGRAYPRRSDGGDLNFYWSGQGGQPTWLWGGSDGNNMYVYNPSNFSVNYANSAGSAATATSATSAGSASTASISNQVNINYSNDSNSTYQLLWGSGNSVYGTGGIYCNPASDTLYANGDIVAFASSDAQFKENVTTITDALEKVRVIGGKYYDWTDDYLNSRGGEDGYHLRKSDFGVIAQDVQSVFPVAVRTRKNGSLAVDYEKLCALAFAAINELQAQVDELKAR